MMFSAPVFRLKRRARRLSRSEGVPLHAALDRIAREEGFARWSLLAAKADADPPARRLHAALDPGDMLLLAARPGHGKTALGLALAVEAARAGRRGAFFTLDWTARDLLAHLDEAGIDRQGLRDGFAFDDSDDIRAERIAGRMAGAPRGSVAVVDYLQILDQKRDNPPLVDQVRTLRAVARERGVVMAFVAQVHRRFDGSGRDWPGLADIRLPNPLDLTLFDKACFLKDGECRVETVARG